MKLINLARIDFGGITGGKAKPEEVFDVQPTTSDQTITPTEGSVFSGGTVRAVTKEIDVNIVSNNIKEGVTILGVAGTLKEEKPEESFNVQPTTAEQTITPTEGSVFSGGTVHAVTSAIDNNIVPENIKEGVSILGVAGTLSEGITPAGTIAINLNGTYDVTNYASAEVNVGDTPDYRYMKGTVDRAGLKAIGWTDEDILTYEQNSLHFTWQDDQYIVSDENKALYLLDDPRPSSYSDNPNITFVPNKNMEDYFTGGTLATFSTMYYIKGIPYYNSQNVTNMDNMFSNCHRLTAVPQLDTHNATRMNSAFRECYKLITIPQLDTSNVTDMNRMFFECFALITIPQLNTSKVTNMGEMFYDCSSLTSIPLLDTSNVIYIYKMFYKCSKLTAIPQLNTSNVTNMNEMFSGCAKLRNIPLLDTSNVTSMNEIFLGCVELRNIPQLNTSKVTSMDKMFNGCKLLTAVPQLDTHNATRMGQMFQGCESLTTVEGIDFSGLTSSPNALIGFTWNMPKLTRFIVNGKINVSISDNYSIATLTAIDYDSVKSILEAANRTDNTDAKTLAFNRTMTDQNGELAALVTQCAAKGWTITGLTLN